MRGDDARDERLDVGAAGELDFRRLAALLRDGGIEAGKLRVDEVGHDHAGAGGEERGAHDATERARAAGDQRNVSVECTHAAWLAGGTRSVKRGAADAHLEQKRPGMAPRAFRQLGLAATRPTALS